MINFKKKEMKIAYIADDIFNLSEYGIYHNGTFGLMLATQKLNENKNLEILLTKVEDLSILNGRVLGNFSLVEVKKELGNYLKIISQKKYFLDELDILFARKDPPIDQNFLSYLQTLTLIPHHGEISKSTNRENKILILNNPEGMLRANEKLYSIHLKDFIPPTLVTQNKSEIIDFLKEYKNAVIKPLFDKGGNGVFKTSIENKNYTCEIDNALSEKQPIIVQKYLDEIINGDKRIFFLNGEIMGGIRRVPKEGEFRAHISRGSTYSKLELSKRDLDICHTIKPYLIRDGLYFVAIDLIGDYLIEVNVTCPSNIIEGGECNSRDFAEEIINWAISNC